jgi:hypothetical protein
MVKIELPANPTESQFEELSRQWDSTRDAEILLPPKITDAERDALIVFLLSKAPNPLALGALCDLAEWPGVPADLLARVFHQGDSACKVAVCLRDDLTPELAEKCRASADVDVREHFAARQTALAREKP